MLAKEIKTGTVVVYNGAPVLINSVNVQTPSARGAATLYKFRGRNLVTKQKTDITLKGTEGLDEADFQKRPVKMMYTDADQLHLLDQTDYNQYSINLEDVEHEMQFLTEELDGVYALIYNDECVGVQLPTAVELNVTQCDPAVKGDSATKRTKPATLETGLVVHVPDYLTEGERVKVSTETGEYLSRA
ncbi:MAG: elongation factor P [Pirellulaceae bacterium]